MGWNMIRRINFMSIDLLLHLFCCEEIFLIRSNAMWNTMMAHKTFCKSMDGSFGGNIAFKEDKFVLE